MALINLVGHTFGNLTVIGISDERTKSGVLKWLCRCACGREKAVQSQALRKGITKSCFECRSDVTGQRFGRLIAVQRTENISRTMRNPSGLVAYDCVCDCGTKKVVRKTHLVGNRVVSCGCHKDERTSARAKLQRKHGYYAQDAVEKHRKTSHGHKWNLFRLTPEAYQARLDKQEGVCAICKQPPTGQRPLTVDHDHACCAGGKKRTCGKCIRGLLCNNCNSGLGMFRDDIDRMTAAITYLNASKS